MLEPDPLWIGEILGLLFSEGDDYYGTQVALMIRLSWIKGCLSDLFFIVLRVYKNGCARCLALLV